METRPIALSLVSLARDMRIGLVVVGPDDDVVAGIEGFFRDSGMPCFAPAREAAEPEGSKTFAKDFMKRHGIPTAAQRLGGWQGRHPPPAYEALDDIMVKARFDSAGSSVVIEEFMEGEEISILTFSDGKTTKTLPPGQDHIRIFEGNTGPYTGGMGVYAPTPFNSAKYLAGIEDKILQPTFAGLRDEERAFKGMLFTGVMMTRTGPKVLEYDVRFGDPETQTMMLLLAEDVDLASVLFAYTLGTLDSITLAVRPGYACNVVVASGGYPGTHETGNPITIESVPHGQQIFHAGTRLVDERLETAGGRILSVAALGAALEDAVNSAYKGIEGVRFKGMYYRKDIAGRWKSHAL
ncbi:phosphoribosylglycinamide synthetase, ATP-grasp (A) domain-containing protein [Hirsutella rhossiliensis]|uniref:phosphoribosylamine--glycine ligase n=1 Tax=Hirsutella rhossiliensis TaxID=111463 RepID=A0A9P8SJJ5_9HYPO|nr:phosphoribosylglycinamide synthetase, ATP-grasp (A) domain-containing protein [Hirsutella rhossiliensis]KAH0963785.1 phosphoribosylglycinamide synthetase, ATP-grasp (A) domain-containing protein [Hirsutella rhossiliensis]